MEEIANETNASIQEALYTMFAELIDAYEKDHAEVDIPPNVLIPHVLCMATSAIIHNMVRELEVMEPEDFWNTFFGSYAGTMKQIATKETYVEIRNLPSANAKH